MSCKKWLNFVPSKSLNAKIQMSIESQMPECQKLFPLYHFDFGLDLPAIALAQARRAGLTFELYHLSFLMPWIFVPFYSITSSLSKEY
jgi:hypothetical protein